LSVEKDVFRRVMGRFPTGVTVITTRHGEHLHGMTANAVTSLSLEPMLVLICVDKTADTHDLLAETGVFTVNILREDQREISDRFAKKHRDGAHKLGGVPYRDSPSGCAIIEGALAYLDCKTVLRYEGGDHTIFVGEVTDAAEEGEGEPLVFYRGRYGKLASG
jgi:flavin reductase (DIM6/NTAB) family NADH-FMN oxidoreductase RutF